MPIAKYKRDKKSGLYYSYQKTGNYKPDGKPERKKLRASTIAALDQKIEEFKQKSAFGVTSTNTTVRQWYDRWITAYKATCRPNTLSWYQTLYRCHIDRKIGSVRLCDVREHHLQSILSEMSATHAKSTVKGVRTILHSMFETAQHNRLIMQNPAAALKIGGKSEDHRRELTLDEREAYLKACKDDAFGLYAAFLYFFGLRRGEALALTGKDVKNGFVRVNKQYIFPTNNQPTLQMMPKTDAGLRDIPIPDAARRYIDFDALPNGLIFTDDLGRPLSYSVVVRRWNKFLERALGEDSPVTIHYLRHNYCTMLAEYGVDMLSAKTYCGHADIKITMNIYTHYSEKLKSQSDAKVRLIV